MKKFCLAISGSDPTCGAGSQLDLQIFNRIGVKPLTIISALTAQTADLVKMVWEADRDSFEQQLNLINFHYPSEYCKVGMIMEQSVCSILNMIDNGNFKSKIILDPILESSSGFKFINKEKLIDLFKKSFLVTPNISEMENILDLQITSVTDMESSVKLFSHKFGTPNVLIKGGHLKNYENIDILFSNGNIFHLDSPKVDKKWETHGTGCYLSSAIAGFLTLGLNLKESIIKSKEMISQDLAVSKRYGNDQKGIFDLF